MIVQTYQSQAVLKILKRGEIYRAKPSISFRGEYGALIELLELKCECPIFGVIKGRRQNTSGKVSATVKMTLDVPDKFVKLTEFGVWADFLYTYKYTKPGNYRALKVDYEEMSIKQYQKILTELKIQKDPSKYEFPQVILEKINPEWLKSYTIYHSKPSVSEKWERFWNKFRK
ncbi:hypothetical protein [Scatolibacter rhodanostii]|uniref:hypothetical protein n=1 Tax=Scatolibacter rhodanostii TaxID=2014781 RepID=UPI001FA90FE4|nr:hypothetical protein [Scatolibacter rhodanostii]